LNQVVKNVLSGLGSFGIAATIWMWGYSIGDGQSDSIVEFIKEDRDSLRAKLKSITDEAESLKVQLLQVPQISGRIQIASNAPEKINSTEPKNTKSIPSQQLRIDRQATGVFLGGKVEITVIGTNYTGDPLRHQVFANVLIPGQEPLKIIDADPGNAYTIGDFQVVITGAGTFSATFKVFEIKT